MTFHKSSDTFPHFTFKPWDPSKTLGAIPEPWVQPPLPLRIHIIRILIRNTDLKLPVSTVHDEPGEMSN